MDVSLAPPPFNVRKKVAMQDYASVSLYSGGGGLVSTAMDYMSTNHLSAGSGRAGFGEQPGVEAVDSGLGFGLGFGVVTDTTKTGVVGSVGEYNWGGAAGTVFWIDPVEELVVVSMIQLMRSPWALRADLQVAVYQALDDIYQ